MKKLHILVAASLAVPVGTTPLTDDARETGIGPEDAMRHNLEVWSKCG